MGTLIFAPITAAPVNFLQQLAGATHRAVLNPFRLFPQRLVFSLAGVARQRFGLVRPLLAFVEPNAISERGESDAGGGGRAQDEGQGAALRR